MAPYNVFGQAGAEQRSDPRARDRYQFGWEGRSLIKTGRAAALAVVLLCSNASISVAQPRDEASELYTTVIELFNAGRYADAVPIAQQVLAIRERAFGRDHPAVGQSLNILAQLYNRQGRYAEAASLYQRSLAIAERANVVVRYSFTCTRARVMGSYAGPLRTAR